MSGPFQADSAVIGIGLGDIPYSYLIMSVIGQLHNCTSRFVNIWDTVQHEYLCQPVASGRYVYVYAYMVSEDAAVDVYEIQVVQGYTTTETSAYFIVLIRQ